MTPNNMRRAAMDRAGETGDMPFNTTPGAADALTEAIRAAEISHSGMSYGDEKTGSLSEYARGWGDCLKAIKRASTPSDECSHGVKLYYDCPQCNTRKKADTASFLTAPAAVPAPSPSEPVVLNRESLIDLIAEHLSGTYHCTRVWSAWSVGTMSQDDFADVGESGTPAEIADAILTLAAPSAPAPSDDLTPVQRAYGWLWHVNTEPMAPVPMLSPDRAAYEARKCLRETLTHEQRGKAINAVQALIATGAAS